MHACSGVFIYRVAEDHICDSDARPCKRSKAELGPHGVSILHADAWQHKLGLKTHASSSRENESYHLKARLTTST